MIGFGSWDEPACERDHLMIGERQRWERLLRAAKMVLSYGQIQHPTHYQELSDAVVDIEKGR